MQSTLEKEILDLRRAHKLHAAVEDRLIELIRTIAPEYHSIKEPVGLAGGRNDLLLFEFSGRKVLFELLATRNQVSRDLRILDKTKADRKIAVIIDKEIDGKVFDAFVRENPEDNYPFIFVGELFQEPPAMAVLKLRELILGDDEAKSMRMLRARIPREDFYTECRKQGIEVLLKEDIKAQEITLAKVFITLVLNKCLKYGIARDRVQNLGKWLSKKEVLDFIFEKMDVGMNVILFTDFLENFSVYSDFELVDWIRASYLLDQPYVIMSLNAIIQEIDKKYWTGKRKLLNRKHPSMFVGMSQVHESKEGRLVIISLPNHTNSIIMIPPAKDPKSQEEYSNMTSVLPPGQLLAVRVGSKKEEKKKHRKENKREE